jgi:cysteinyl-tRNA synthetase
MRLFNTLSRSEEEFRPLDPAGKRVTLYCCGPTVYNFAHIGNFRTFVFEDLLRRHLEARGYAVVHVMNITDVEDKIIRTISQTGETLQALTRRYEQAFLADFQTIGCQLPTHMPRATEMAPDIIRFIQKLMDKGFAYRTDDGSVYFSIEKFKSYGKLSRLDRDQLKPGARVSQDEHARESYGDFALWKTWTEKDGSVAWDTPWGRGRPGWHIECSCMSMKHLGETIDLHCGGEDLVFPHHEDEIAQSEAATGKPFVRYWLHGAHLLVNGQKMAKKEGNFFTVRDLLGRGYTGREIRYALMGAHYRLPLNFTLEGLESARQSLRRIDAWVERLQQVVAGPAGTSGAAGTTEHRLAEPFLAALDADLNIADAFGQLFEVLRLSNRAMDDRRLAPAAAKTLLEEWRQVERALGLPANREAGPPAEVEELARQRQQAREQKNWKRSDELRAAIREKGWLVQDASGGYKLTKA